VDAAKDVNRAERLAIESEAAARLIDRSHGGPELVEVVRTLAATGDLDRAEIARAVMKRFGQPEAMVEVVRAVALLH